MDTEFLGGQHLLRQEQMTLRDIVKALRQTYCGTIGPSSCTSRTRRRSAGCSSGSIDPLDSELPAGKKRHILNRLTAAEGLERYLHTKYVGQKRFSLEGGESFIAAMDELIQRAGESGVEEIVIGMAHRGRVNVLVNTLGKTPTELFAEFEGKAAIELPAGDVKYHLGFSSDVSTPGGRFTCRLPSTRRTWRSSTRW